VPTIRIALTDDQYAILKAYAATQDRSAKMQARRLFLTSLSEVRSKVTISPPSKAISSNGSGTISSETVPSSGSIEEEPEEDDDEHYAICQDNGCKAQF
jgi:hypothetical protein